MTLICRPIFYQPATGRRASPFHVSPFQGGLILSMLAAIATFGLRATGYL